jgi:hypothetical protein
MAKFELTKTVEARKLHKRTLAPLSDPPVSIPFGAIIENVQNDRDVEKFYYLGEPYQSPSAEIKPAMKPIS